MQSCMFDNIPKRRSDIYFETNEFGLHFADDKKYFCGSKLRRAENFLSSAKLDAGPRAGKFAWKFGLRQSHPILRYRPVMGETPSSPHYPTG